MEDLFDFQALRVAQPAKWRPDRATYEIFTGDRQRVASVTETAGHSQLSILRESVPDTRVFAVTTPAGQPVFSLVKQASNWVTELRDPAGELAGTIGTGNTRRTYTLRDTRGQAVGEVEGDLALKNYQVYGTGRRRVARVRKTWAGLAKEILTPSDHYMVEFTGPVTQPARTLIVMMPIVIDLTSYGPV